MSVSSRQGIKKIGCGEHKERNNLYILREFGTALSLQTFVILSLRGQFSATQAGATTIVQVPNPSSLPFDLSDLIKGVFQSRYILSLDCNPFLFFSSFQHPSALPTLWTLALSSPSREIVVSFQLVDNLLPLHPFYYPTNSCEQPPS